MNDPSSPLVLPPSTMLKFTVPGTNFTYQGAAVAGLTSFEHTVALGLFDESGSTSAYAKLMEKCCGSIVKALRHSPAAAKLLYGQYHYDTHFREFHGFKPLRECNEADYDGCWAGGGKTTQYDSEEKAISFVEDYAKQQAKMHYTCNGIIWEITDGQDWGSILREADVKKRYAKALSSEELESLMFILIGVNDDPDVQNELQRHATECNFTQYIPLTKADEKTLAALAGFIVKSTLSQSQHLGTGGPSQPLPPPKF